MKKEYERQPIIIKIHSNFMNGTKFFKLTQGMHLFKTLFFKSFCDILSEYRTRTEDQSDIFPYGFAATSGELDDAVEALGQVFQRMLQLAQIEKTSQLLAEEIEKTRRRVNALEYIMMPRYLETIKTIKMKLEENERGNTTRLMKVKDMMLAAQMQQQADQTVDEA